MTKATNAKIERLSRVLLPKYGLNKVSDLVATVKVYCKTDGYASIGRPNGDWSWGASPASTVVTPNRIVLAFRGDYRRNSAVAAREDIYRQLEKAIEDTMPEDEAEALLQIYDEKS